MSLKSGESHWKIQHKQLTQITGGCEFNSGLCSESQRGEVPHC